MNFTFTTRTWIGAGLGAAAGFFAMGPLGAAIGAAAGAAAANAFQPAPPAPAMATAAAGVPAYNSATAIAAPGPALTVSKGASVRATNPNGGMWGQVPNTSNAVVLGPVAGNAGAFVALTAGAAILNATYLDAQGVTQPYTCLVTVV